jgi:hypothetical protein
MATQVNAKMPLLWEAGMLLLTVHALCLPQLRCILLPVPSGAAAPKPADTNLYSSHRLSLCGSPHLHDSCLLCLQSGAAAPKPADAGVFINNMPAMDVYVISFGGWANEATYKQQAAALMQKLKDEKLPFDSRYAVDLSNRVTFCWMRPSCLEASAACCLAVNRQPYSRSSAC